MQSLIFGMIAALTWGFHDFLVRHVSQRAGAAPLLFVALLSGSAAFMPVAALLGNWGQMNLRAAGFALTSGLCFGLANVALYRAFAIGPVRLVAPITGTFPMLSIGITALQGNRPQVWEWLAVLAVLAGIALVAHQKHTMQAGHRTRLMAMAWAALASVCFALTFAAGQFAVREGADLPVLLLTRLAALALIGTTVFLRRDGLTTVRPYLKLLCVIGSLDVIALGFVLAAGRLANPEYASITSSTYGMVTILLAWRFMGEPMQPLQWLGVAVVF
ncbi:MAG: DMT family transporter, partial [Paracoccaceae bacterium]|nr:DMT family transporter [Paracoccaceae bacterium]